MAGVTGKSDAAPMPMSRPDASELPSGGGFGDWVSGLFKAEGGGIMPRHHYADGGGEDSQGDEAVPYDPSDVMSGKDPMEGVLKAGGQKPQMLKPSGGGGGGGGGGLGGDIAKGLAMAKTAASLFAMSDKRLKDNVRPVGKTFDGQNIYSYNLGDKPTQLGLIAQEVRSKHPDAVGHRGKYLTVNYDEATQNAANRGHFYEGGIVPRQHFEGGGDAEQPVRKYFDYLTKEKGYEPQVAAGILGNAYHESSGLQPGIVGDEGKSIGLFQFHEKGEQPAFRQWASENQRDIADPYAQLDFVHNQLQGPYAKTLNQMRSAADPSSAAESFMRGYERPKEGPTAALDRRQAYANAIASGEKLPTFRAYSGNQAGLGGAGQEAIQRATSGEGNGLGGAKHTSFIDGIGFNKQTILPLLQGIGAMASSKSISPWAAALQGLGAGAKAYGEEETRQAGTALTDSQTVNQFMDASRKALMANPANPSILMVLTPRGWMTQGQAQRLGLPTIGAPLPAAAGATALRRQGLQQAGLGTTDAGQLDVTSATTPPVPKIDAISDAIPASQNKVQALSVPGAYYDTQARAAAQADAGSSNISAAQSEEVRKDIDRSARQASDNKPVMHDLTQNTAALIANPAAGTGPFSNPRQSVLGMADYASRLFLGKGLPEGSDPSDLQISKKLASYLAGQQTSAVNQNSLQAFSTALGAAPNSELSPKALANLTAMLMVQKSRAERIGEFARVYGEDAEGRLSANAIRQYDRIHGKQMQDEQSKLADFFVKYPKAAQKVASGEIPYDVAAQKFKDLYGRPDMAYHFQNR
jgi:hypothetical protein